MQAIQSVPLQEGLTQKTFVTSNLFQNIEGFKLLPLLSYNENGSQNPTAELEEMKFVLLNLSITFTGADVDRVQSFNLQPLTFNR